MSETETDVTNDGLKRSIGHFSGGFEARDLRFATTHANSIFATSDMIP